MRLKTKNTSTISINRRPNVEWVLPHVHDIFELVYIVDGQGVLSIYNKEIKVEKGDLLFYDVTVMHCLNKVDKLEAVNIVIEPGVFADEESSTNHLIDLLALTWFRDFTVEEEPFKAFVHFSEVEQKSMIYLIEAMLKEFENKDLGYERALFGYTNVIFTLLFRQLKCEIGMEIRQDISTISDNVLAYIEKNYDKKISLGDLAKQSFYQPNYFSTVFKECYGLSPMKYVNKMRIEKAMYELRYTQVSISAIMDMVGIHDRKHFYSLFKEFVGVTPGAYRADPKSNKVFELTT